MRTYRHNIKKKKFGSKSQKFRKQRGDKEIRLPPPLDIEYRKTPRGIQDNIPILMRDYVDFIAEKAAKAMPENIEKMVDFDKKIGLLKRLPHQSSPSYIPFFEFPNSYSFENQQTIPKILHLIWISPKKIIGPDGNEIPRKEQKISVTYARYFDTWVKHNPDWKIWLWTDEQVDDSSESPFPLYNRRLYNSLFTASEKSDILRYEIIYQFGGYYVDMDMECIRPLPEKLLCEEGIDHVFMQEQSHDLTLASNFFGAKAGTALLDYVIRRFQYSTSKGPINRTGPGFLTLQIADWVAAKQMGWDTRIRIFPHVAFNGHDFLYKFSRDIINPEHTYSIHHYGMSWSSESKREFYNNQRLTAEVITNQTGGDKNAKLLIPPQPADIYDTVFETPDVISQPLTSIPKILHHIWLGKSGIPINYLKYYETARRFHRDWKLWLWSDEEIEWLNLQNRTEFYRAIEYAQKSDIARYEILYRYGGVYSDSDNEFVRSIDVIKSPPAFFASYVDEKREEITNSFIGAIRKSPVLKCTIDNIPISMRDEYKIIKQTGPAFLTRCIARMGGNNPPKIAIYDYNVFVGLRFLEKFRRDKIDISKTIVIHHYGMSWFSERKRAEFEKQMWDTINEREEFRQLIRQAIAAKRGFRPNRGGSTTIINKTKKRKKTQENTLRDIFIEFSKKNRD